MTLRTPRESISSEQRALARRHGPIDRLPQISECDAHFENMAHTNDAIVQYLLGRIEFVYRP